MTNDQDIDNFIKSKLQNLPSKSYLIQPSHDFVERTMKRIRKIEKQRRFWIQVWIVVASLAPLVVRETWMFVRGDYFSISSMPIVGGLLAAAYQLFLSPVAMVLLLFGGITASIIYIFRFRKNYDSFAKIA